MNLQGAGRVAFSNQQSYIAAISARFVQLQHGDIDKRVEVKPYVLDDQMCDECQGSRCGGKFAPFFCANVTCLQVSSPLVLNKLCPLFPNTTTNLTVHFGTVLLRALLDLHPFAARAGISQAIGQGGSRPASRRPISLVLTQVFNKPEQVM